MTRKWAYRAIRQGWPEFSQWLDAVIQRVEMYNASLPVPLSPPECRAIGKSIAKYTHRNFTPETFAQYVADTHTLTYVFVPLALTPDNNDPGSAPYSPAGRFLRHVHQARNSSGRRNEIPFRLRIDSSKPTYRQNRCCKNGSDHRSVFQADP